MLQVHSFIEWPSKLYLIRVVVHCSFESKKGLKTKVSVSEYTVAAQDWGMSFFCIKFSTKEYGFSWYRNGGGRIGHLCQGSSDKL